MLKAQVSAEFVLTLALTFLLLLAIALVYSGELSSSSLTQERMRALHTAFLAADAANSAFLGGHGTRVYTPLDGIYNISISNRQLSASLPSGASASAPLLSSNVSISAPANGSDSITASNTNGVVSIV